MGPFAAALVLVLLSPLPAVAQQLVILSAVSNLDQETLFIAGRISELHPLSPLNGTLVTIVSSSPEL
jgi:hypothetical protein